MSKKELNLKVIEVILQEIEKDPTNLRAYSDLFETCKNIEEDDFELSHSTNQKLKDLISQNLAKTKRIRDFFELYKKCLLFDAPHNFDSYMLYLEINRKPDERFYRPRRNVLKPLVDAIQDLVDDRLDELFISQPPRTGKTTLLMFLMTWILGRYPEKTNLYSAFSDTITSAFFDGVLEVIGDPVTYTWAEIFPQRKIADKNKKQETVDIDRSRRYHSLTARSLYGTLNGACDCNGFLVSDDLIGGIEEALNRDRLEAAWSKVDNNLIPRAKESAKLLWCGTRWSLIDPAGLRMELIVNDPAYKQRRYRIINLPALNENDESNFLYEHNVGFSSDYYKQRRASFERNNDIASWNAQYMGEPIERDGSVFAPNDFMYYNGELPEGEPDRVFMAVDPAYGGGDFTASPVCLQFDDMIYVHDVIYSDADKRTTLPLLVNAVKKYDVQAIRFECSKSTEGYKNEFAEMLSKSGIRINIISKPAPNNTSKWNRVFDKAPEMREHMVFRESGRRTVRYEKFIQNVFSFKMFAKNKHDDAPDSLAMAIDMAFHANKKIEGFKRPF